MTLALSRPQQLSGNKKISMKHIIVLFLFFQMLSVSAFAQQYKYHIVEQGETVESVARKYNVTKEEIFKLNPDARNGIRSQSKLVVPLGKAVQEDNDKEVEFETHRVKRKETLFSLSREYNVEIEDIRRFNKHLYSEELRRGERIRIPVGLQKPTEVATEVPNEKFQTDESPQNPLNLTAKEHVVLPKEGKYGISRKYNITIEELNRLNPGVDELRPGMVLKVSNGATEKVIEVEGGLFKYYLVEPQETLFSLTRELGISRDSLIGLNPALAEGLKAGMVLKIPNLETPGVEASYAADEDIVNLEQRISNYDTKEIVVMLPFKLDQIESTDTTTNARAQIKKDKVMQISLDFYSGVMMAIDSAKTMGLSTNVRVFDTKQDVSEVNHIINTQNFSGVDAVIGPILQSTAEAAAGKLRDRGIPVVSPLTKKEAGGMDNFYQTRPTDEMLTEVMISYLQENSAGKNVVIIADASSSAKRQKLMASLPGARALNPGGSQVNRNEVASALVKGRPNWVILEGSSIGVLSNATSYLNSLADAYDITLFTTNKTNSFESDNISHRHLSKLHFHFPSVDKEFSKDRENHFISAYIKKYDVVPNTYAVRGFDVTYDILLRLATAESLAESMKEELTTEYVENKFSYGETPTGGFLNRAIYIMAYDDDLNLKVIR
jgi:LysM repeat protein/ABC-type branched-subunit amino acid transport system substrate-binding protein